MPTYDLEKSNDGCEPSDMPTTVHLSVHLHPTESPMTVVLAFRHANNGTSQRPLTLYRKSNDGGVSLPKCRQWYITVRTYYLQKVQWRWG